MPKALDTLLGHCLLRAMVHEEGGIEAVGAMAAAGERYSKWGTLRLTAKLTPKASRVASFIVMWAISMKMEGLDEYTITEYQRYWNENERQAYRLQREFRELFPEFETPNELARQIVKQVDARMARKAMAKLPLTLQVEA